MTSKFAPDTVSYPVWSVAEELDITDGHARAVLFFWAACIINRHRPTRCTYVLTHPWVSWLHKLSWDIWGKDLPRVRDALQAAVKRGLEYTAQN